MITKFSPQHACAIQFDIVIEPHEYDFDFIYVF